jgi:hypothetical protein
MQLRHSRAHPITVTLLLCSSLPQVSEKDIMFIRALGAGACATVSDRNAQSDVHVQLLATACERPQQARDRALGAGACATVSDRNAQRYVHPCCCWSGCWAPPGPGRVACFIGAAVLQAPGSWVRPSKLCVTSQ